MSSSLQICRACQSKDIHHIHDFGVLPVADKLMQAASDEVPSFPLSLSYCSECCLLQINENVDPELLFRSDYPYFSSFIPEVKEHFEALYNQVTRKYEWSRDDSIVEIAGNDGVLLRHFLSNQNEVINIEPSLGPARVAESLGIQTVRSFFTSEEAVNLKSKLSRDPRFIFAANVLAHVPKPKDFVAGLAKLAGEETTLVIEVPHVLPMIKRTLFDVVFHQHFSYFSLHALQHMFVSEDLFIQEVEKIPTQGGSLRLFIGKERTKKAIGLNEILSEEQEFGICSVDTFMEFSKRIISLKHSTMDLLTKLKKENNTIVGYGAPGKAANTLNYFGINQQHLAYLVDVSSSKHGFIFPNTGLEIFPVDRLIEDKPEVVLILAWNYKDSIMAYLKERLPEETRYISIL